MNQGNEPRSGRVRVVGAIVMVSLITCIASSLRADVLLVSGFFSDSVGRYCPLAQQFVGNLGPGGDLDGAQSTTLGPDGLLYVCSEQVNKILRYDPASWGYVDEFIADDPLTPGDETGGLIGPTAGIFGPDGAFYVASFGSNAVLRYDGASGSFLGVFVPSGLGNLSGPDAGMTFGPENDLYVPGYFSHNVVRYDGGTGAHLGDFVAPGAGGLVNPRVILFRPELNDVLISSEGSNRVIRYDAGSGTPLGDFIAGVSSPSGLARDASGDVYVASTDLDSVGRYAGGSGAFIETAVPIGEGGLNGPTFLLITESNDCDGPANDFCDDWIFADIGMTPFLNLGAGTDGPDEAGLCGHLERDVWFLVFAPCDGLLTIDTCDSDFDTMLALYPGNCPGSPGTALACNDNFCGSGSRIAIPTTSGSIYRLRVGGAFGAQGSGTLLIHCGDPPACPDVNGDATVDADDFLAVLRTWGPCSGCPEDITGDGAVDGSDFLAVLAGWGPCL